MTRTKQQDFEQAQVLHLIRDERDLELEDKARGRAHTGLQMGCLLLAALCYLQGDPAWTIFLALPLLGWSIQCFCRYAGDREPLFLAGGLLSGLPALLLGRPFLNRILGTGPLSPGRLDGRGPMGGLFSVCLYPAVAALSGGSQSAGFGSHCLGQRPPVLRPGIPRTGAAGPGIPRRRRVKAVPQAEPGAGGTAPPAPPPQAGALTGP